MVGMLSEPCGEGNRTHYVEVSINRVGGRSERDLRSDSAKVACEAGDLFELPSDGMVGTEDALVGKICDSPSCQRIS